MNIDERALAFPCQDDWLYGILSLPAQTATRGVLVIVGGPQYRAGSHRQFTLLARHLAEQGIPVMRFDYRGMGDSQGDARNFEDIGDDIRAAIDHFMTAAPGLQEVVLWGLCDAASAALIYAAGDKRVQGLVLLNPWVRTERGMARAYLKHYYLQRLFTPGFWQKIARGGFDFRDAARSLVEMLGNARRSGRPVAKGRTLAASGQANTLSFLDRMHAGLREFTGPILLILSGNDLTAQEFSSLISSSPKWRKLLRNRAVRRHQLADANHTFSQQAWRDQVADWTAEWLRAW